MLKRFWTWLRYQLVGHSREIRAYERVAVMTLMRELGDEYARAAATQLSARVKVQRQDGDTRVLIWYDDSPNLPLLPDVEPARRLGKVQLAAGGRVVQARVYSHKGLINDVQFTADPRGLGDPITASVVTLGKHRGRPRGGRNA